MNWTRWAIGGLLGLAAVLFFFSFTAKDESAKAKPDAKPAVTKSAGARHASDAQADLKPGAKTRKKLREAKAKQLAQAPAKGEKPVAVAEKRETDPAKVAAAEKAVAKWESLVDELVEAKEAPTGERKASVKEAFDQLDKADQLPAVQAALNLLPDSQFPSLYGILYDKTENPDVLDAIFSDALNRPEELKVPVMKDLVKDKQHPMFFESARILDVTGELDNMAGEQSGTEAEAEEEETTVVQ